MIITEQQLLQADRKTIESWLAMGLDFRQCSLPVLLDIAKKYNIHVPPNATRTKIINAFHRFM